MGLVREVVPGHILGGFCFTEATLGLKSPDPDQPSVISQSPNPTACTPLVLGQEEAELALVPELDAGGVLDPGDALAPVASAARVRVEDVVRVADEEDRAVNREERLVRPREHLHHLREEDQNLKQCNLLIRALGELLKTARQRHIDDVTA